MKDQTSRDYSFGHLIGVHTIFVMRIRISASLWGRDIPRPRYKRALFNVQLEMSGDVCSSELFISCSETPVSLFSNRCDTCGKSFVHSSSYRRHTRTQCASQSRKRCRKLWISDGVNVDEEDVGVAPLLNTSQCETEGKFFCYCLLLWESSYIRWW